MSSSNKEILIKYVAQAIPAYVMSVFKLPASVCDELTRLIRQYWWGVEKGKHKMAWFSWDKMRLPKFMGGMGFRDMRAFNQALLANKLCVLWIHQRVCVRGYYKGEIFLLGTCWTRCSPITVQRFGKEYCTVLIYFKKVLSGEWGMGRSYVPGGIL